MRKNESSPISRGLTYLSSSQLNNGGFESFWKEKGNIIDNQPRHTTFFPSLILTSLSGIKADKAEKIKNKILLYLLTQKSKDWTFNYWDRDKERSRERKLPDDLDDTFCALIGLYQHNKNIFTGETLASIAHILFRTETKAGGPYRTWIVPNDTKEKSWLDIDPAVNANVAYFLSLQSIELPELKRYLEKVITANLYTSPYYPNQYPIIYFVSRCYEGAKKYLIVEKILESKDKSFWGSPMKAALALNALMTCRTDLSQLIDIQEYLLEQQNIDGSWDADDFCIDSTKRKTPIAAGAKTLTTAFVIEALGALERINKSANKSKYIKNIDTGLENAHSKSINAVVRDIESIENIELRKSVEFILEQIRKRKDVKQIILLPYLISNKRNTNRSRNSLKLSLISLWGWMTYMTYDTFLDEGGDKSLLPAANYCHRKLVNVIASTLHSNNEFQSECIKILDRMDAANAWELRHCRVNVVNDQIEIKKLPDYGNRWQLADRSLGHLISVLGVMYDFGFETDSISMTKMRESFINYLIARQLHDDAHDWEEDLKHGHINAVGNKILKAYFGSNPGKKINLHKDIDELRNIMWKSVIIIVTKLIKSHVNKSLLALNFVEPQINTLYLKKEISSLTKSANETLGGRRIALDFVKGL